MEKKKEVSVVRTEFKLNDEAIDEFKAIHNKWEFEVCEKNPHNALLRDNFRGSHFSEKSLSFSLCLFCECFRYLFEWKIPCASLGSSH